ncbi:MAG: hypothetical protein ABDK94_10695 [Atribacterota bacterium]
MSEGEVRFYILVAGIWSYQMCFCLFCNAGKLPTWGSIGLPFRGIALRLSVPIPRKQYQEGKREKFMSVDRQ